ncbi:hypothetical protein GCM10022384_55590 [Streptomyces marokkonensis]|uniref:Tellurite resistance protein TerB n=1 Tax=Streptomyces marokkonensis TaxID=324855 RepID=A0ABP7RSE0_9ACTN
MTDAPKHTTDSDSDSGGPDEAADQKVVEIGIPLVGVPLSVLLNRYTTLVAVRHARAVFRWLVIRANAKAGIADDEALLMRHLVRLVRELHEVVDEQLAQVVDIDPAEVWKRVDAEPGDLSDVLDAAERVATVDGDVNSREKAILAELEGRCHRD